MPKITINGQEIEVKEGSTIIEAMHSNNQRIAHYCWHPGLSVAGVCRLCMCEIEGNPRLQIACNTVATEGMKINNTSDKVKDGAKWGLDFHLINHPLDCPICDQAGECGLQDQYMEFGKYDPEMAEKKQKKHKVVDLGPTVVLDSERCILCSRCVRFTDEVTKTHELGIFNRGDRSEIGTHDGKLLDNKYSMNTVDLCPVGALTSKDFRFRQRVWYLKDQDTICNGCSTGCHVKTYFNKEGFFRVKPRYSADVNGYWMCDEGRDIYKFVNRENRLLMGSKKSEGRTEEMLPGAAAKDAGAVIKANAAKTAVIVTGQYSVEEYEALFQSFVKELGVKKIFHWVNNRTTFEAFDGMLLRGDRNPNTKGLLQAFEKFGIAASNWADLETGIANGSINTIVVAGPENQAWFPELKQMTQLVGRAANVIWMQSCRNADLMALNTNLWVIPMKSFVEKDGTFVNVKGLAQQFKKVTTVVSEALTLVEAASLLVGQNVMIRPQGANPFVEAARRADAVTLENRKKNEFVFRRGPL